MEINEWEMLRPPVCFHVCKSRFIRRLGRTCYALVIILVDGELCILERRGSRSWRLLLLCGLEAFTVASTGLMVLNQR